MLSHFLRGILIALLVCGGCAYEPIAREVRIYRPGEPDPQTTTAPFKGTYILVRGARTPESQAMLQADLHKGDPLGFRVLPSGEIEAVAGTRTVVITPAEHVWIGTPSHRELEVGKTLIVVAIVVGAIVTVVFLAAFLNADAGSNHTL